MFEGGAVLRVLLIFLGVLALVGCSTAPPDAGPADDFRQRAHVHSADGFSVSVAALGIGESETRFGVPLNDFNVQPVWIRIENRTDIPQWLFPITVDNNYFPPYEVARRAGGFSSLAVEDLYRRLNQ